MGVEYAHAAANTGHVEAYNALGYAYLEGKGVEANATKALEYYTIAANYG